MKETTKIWVFFAIVANVILILWILYKGISAGFSGTWFEIVSYSVLMIVLAINSILLIVKSKE
jgi:hypothetical protein